MAADSGSIAKLLEKASESYYRGLPSPLSDGEFDSLRDKLASLAPDHPFLKTVGAPVTIGVWPKRKHDHFMGSLAKVNEEPEYDHWRKKKSGLVQISHKLDGSTIAITYDKGELVHAVTRGDGEEGEDITPNVLKMSNVKQKLPVPFSGAIRGEMILLKKTFDKHFAPLGYKNPRNAANGCARDKKGNGLLKHIKVIYFDLKTSSRIESMTNEQIKAKFVGTMGLDFVHTDYAVIDKVWEYFDKFDRDSLPYHVDGLVCKLNDIVEQEKLGVVDGRPRGQIALKWPGKSAKTTIKGITWQVGLSGRITPVAELEPIDLDGVTISRSTLNNLDYIRALDVAIGDIVEITRLGDVIPGVTKVVDRSGRQFICSNCGR